MTEENWQERERKKMVQKSLMLTNIEEDLVGGVFDAARLARERANDPELEYDWYNFVADNFKDGMLVCREGTDEEVAYFDADTVVVCVFRAPWLEGKKYNYCTLVEDDGSVCVPEEFDELALTPTCVGSTDELANVAAAMARAVEWLKTKK